MSAGTQDKQVNIGEIIYANCTPIFSMLRSRFDCSGYRFVQGVPAALNRLLSEGKIDVCPSSSIVFARNPDKLEILPGLSISSDGSVRSVLLYSNLPLENLDGKKIALSSESETSVNLLKIILGRYYRFRSTFTTVVGSIEEALSQYDAVLAIGDAALRGRTTSPPCLVYDLGELWKELTGLPFVFALWLVRRGDVPAREVGELHRRLLEAKDLSRSRLEELAERAPEREWMDREGLVDYWRIISYDLLPSHVEGLKLFYRYAAELGLIPGEPSLRFFQG